MKIYIILFLTGIILSNVCAENYGKIDWLQKQVVTKIATDGNDCSEFVKVQFTRNTGEKDYFYFPASDKSTTSLLLTALTMKSEVEYQVKSAPNWTTCGGWYLEYVKIK